MINSTLGRDSAAIPVDNDSQRIITPSRMAPLVSIMFLINPAVLSKIGSI
jgi:hypothetical protein